MVISLTNVRPGTHGGMGVLDGMGVSAGINVAGTNTLRVGEGAAAVGRFEVPA
jgi:hypothetical protein